MLAVFIHLDDTEPENGGLVVFPGSHKLGPQRDAAAVQGVHFVDQAIAKFCREILDIKLLKLLLFLLQTFINKYIKVTRY